MQYHLPSSRYTPAEQMNVDETAVFIWTFAWSKRWPESETYSNKFRDNQISGECLKDIGIDMLKNDLEIVNLEHQYEILSMIKILFPLTKKLVDRFSSRCSSVVSQSIETVHSDTSNFSNFSACSLKEEDEHIGRKLILILSHTQLLEEIKVKDIEQKFADFGFAVQIDEENDSPGRYVVGFENEGFKKQAHKQATAIGYNLVKKRRPRPSPRNPVLYWASCRLTIRDGKAINKDVTGEVNKDELVLVNNIKGRRARLEDINTGHNRGWVSLQSLHGDEYLRRVKLIDKGFPIEKFLEPHKKCAKEMLRLLQQGEFLKTVKET